MNLRNVTSTRPRKAITTPAVTRIDQPTAQPWCTWDHVKAAGLVSRATKVAARISVRHWSRSCWRSCWRASAGAVPSTLLTDFSVVATLLTYDAHSGSFVGRFGRRRGLERTRHSDSHSDCHW